MTDRTQQSRQLKLNSDWTQR